MSSDRPVYIPSRKRQKNKKNERFHGAFTGGFSAGHFNTVDTEEGWAPDDPQNVRKKQTPQDFMDSQDHNEWGGPTSVRQEYSTSTQSANTTAALKNDAMLQDLMIQPPQQNVGHRLLRILGWRDGSTAYVPQEEHTATLFQPQSVESLLSSKRLKKIQLQQERVKIPPPKLDTCGLGYEPFQNAPEFRAHKERRRREAQQRAKAVTGGSADNRNVYRLSNLLDKDDDGEENAHSSRIRRHQEEEDDDPLVSFENEQSFVGTKTVGGFALHDDADDVYDDDNTGKLHSKGTINREEYDNEVYEHASDVEDDGMEHHTAAKTESEFGSVFASWATSKANGNDAQSTTGGGITSDGRPPLSGFVLGSSSSGSKVQKRYPGPDIPDGYEAKRHEFGKNEFAGAWKDESHAARMELMEQRQKKQHAERKAELLKKQKERESGPMASSAFAGLALAMKNRFTSSAPESSATEPSRAAGLQAGGTTGESLATEPLSAKAAAPPKPITIKRSTMTFTPESLLCKRFHVVPPAHAQPTGKKATAELKGEHAYFEREILSKAASAAPSLSRDELKRPASKTMLRDELLGEEETPDEPARPSMKVLESIFEPESEQSESEEEKDTNDTVAETKDQVSSVGHVEVRSAASIPNGVPQTSLIVQEEIKHEQEQKSESRKEKRRRSRDNDDRKRRRRSRSRSPSADSSSDRSRRKRSRKREEKKKRKKRHKSSRRKGDKYDS